LHVNIADPIFKVTEFVAIGTNAKTRNSIRSELGVPEGNLTRTDTFPVDASRFEFGTKS
jgi:hypothetical protein